MITTGQLRIFAKEFIRQLTRDKVVQSEDIRWLKSGNGVFPRKYVWEGEKGRSNFTETPYVADDTFILFDIIQDKNQAAERIGDIVYSMLPFTIIVNVYGSASPDEVQYMLHKLHTYATRLWLQSQKISLTWEPEDFQTLDGRENASWWIRRRFEVKLNAQQEIKYESGIEGGDEIENITHYTNFSTEGR